uniref:Rhodanese domain-containing protein n=1 Tax=Alexandrium monilatum TaxID=311494 RepID=A0A7S4WJI8_9DINO|mmetsp:Transcript_35668/g.111288  ORF Transcript_35668/g.111288 Transcript_35668/m.111288 type:complete len:196 (-) Transcript_35668:88-675(-)
MGVSTAAAHRRRVSPGAAASLLAVAAVALLRGACLAGSSGLAWAGTVRPASLRLPLQPSSRPGSRTARHFMSIRAPQAAALLETGEWAYLDVRRSEEQQAVGVPALPAYGAGLHTVTSHVPGPNGMVFDVTNWLKKVEARFPDKRQKLVVGCASGVRSKAAAQVLEDAGYTEVQEMDDGFMGWRAQGLPVVEIPS